MPLSLEEKEILCIAVSIKACEVHLSSSGSLYIEITGIQTEQPKHYNIFLSICSVQIGVFLTVCCVKPNSNRFWKEISTFY